MNRTRTFAIATIITALAAAPGTAFDTPDPEKAEVLRHQAEALYSAPGEWLNAAQLLEESASLREAADARAYTCLLYAGRLRAGRGDMKRAQVTLTQAGEHALARGEIADAATAFIDAAHAAMGARRGADAKTLLERAELLISSPLLEAAERAALESRLR